MGVLLSIEKIVAFTLGISCICYYYLVGNLITMLVLQWFAGAMLIVIGVLILSKSSIEKKTSMD